MKTLTYFITVLIFLSVSGCSSDDEKEIIIPTTDLGFHYWSDALETNKLYRIDNIEELKDAKGEYYAGSPEINFDKNTLLLVRLDAGNGSKRTRILIEKNSNLYNLEITIEYSELVCYEEPNYIAYPTYIAVLTPKIKEDVLVQHSVNTKIKNL